MHPRDASALAQTLLAGSYPDTGAPEVAAAVEWLAQSIGAGESKPDAVGIRKAVRLFNDRLLFEHTRLLAAAWQSCRAFDPEITKRHAQALIELSALDAAARVLDDAVAAIDLRPGNVSTAVERLEYEGLRGRIAKQRFVATGDIDELALATDRYLVQYNQPAHPYWHGINAVALMSRERREGVRRPLGITTEALARDILSGVEREYTQNSSDVWLSATASEAYLALGECDQAEFWLYRFLQHPRVEPFHVNSYGRQLQEIWQGSAVGAGGACADRLTGILARHVARTQGRWSVSPRAGTDTDVITQVSRALANDASVLEKNFSGEIGFSVNTLKQMLAACAAIGCVTNTTGERLGTGFLVDGSSLKASFGSAPVFVTNAHVISEVVPNAIRPANALVTFEIESTGTGKPEFYAVEEVLFTSPPGPLGGPAAGALDVTIVRLKSISGSYSRLPASEMLPLVDAQTKAYVVGHPRGSGLQISLHDSVLLDIDDAECLVHYRTPTDPGSSGSPVFNTQWEVIALHHSGSSTTPRLHGTGHYEANEGIALCAIRATLNG